MGIGHAALEVTEQRLDRLAVQVQLLGGTMRARASQIVRARRLSVIAPDEHSRRSAVRSTPSVSG